MSILKTATSCVNIFCVADDSKSRAIELLFVPPVPPRVSVPVGERMELFTWMFPWTSRVAFGEVVPIPTLPVPSSTNKVSVLTEKLFAPKSTFWAAPV